MEDCIKCGMSLSGGDLTLPWEDDDSVSHTVQPFSDALPSCIVIIVDGQIDEIRDGLSTPFVTELIQLNQTLRCGPQHWAVHPQQCFGSLDLLLGDNL